jgi:hypothetical protein
MDIQPGSTAEMRHIGFGGHDVEGQVLSLCCPEDSICKGATGARGLSGTCP